MAKKLKILIPDDLHLNRRNFPSFHKFAEQSGAELHFCADRREMIACFGNYTGHSALSAKVRMLKTIGLGELENFAVAGINLFTVCRGEILSALLPKSEWQLEPLPDTKTKLFKKIWSHDRQILVDNLAVTWDWIDYWETKLADLPVFTHACIFSGSLIYQRTLIELLRATPTRVMVMESAFTGNDYYCEEKYEPIANNSNIKFDTIYSMLSLPDDPTLYERERNKALNKMLMSKNKNVIQPITSAPIAMPKGEKQVLIIGQVVNDFSLIESRRTGIAAIPFYKSLIDALVRQNLGVIFKSHPWEEKKNNVKHRLTFNAIEAFVGKLPQELRERVVITDHFPLKELFDSADIVVGLNSQALIEAAFSGHKPIQFGEAFFGYRGFTYDRNINEVTEVAAQIASENLSGKLSMSDLIAFEEFSVKYFQQQLVSVHQSGISILKDRFANHANVPIVKGGSMTIETPNSPGDHKNELQQTSELGSMKDKQEKLLKDPHAFFRDAKNPALRRFRYFFRQ